MTARPADWYSSIPDLVESLGRHCREMPRPITAAVLYFRHVKDAHTHDPDKVALHALGKALWETPSGQEIRYDIPKAQRVKDEWGDFPAVLSLGIRP